MCACDLQNEDDPGEGCSGPSEQQTDRRTERSIEESRKLILQWASELQSVDKVNSKKDKHLNHAVLFWNTYRSTSVRPCRVTCSN